MAAQLFHSLGARGIAQAVAQDVNGADSLRCRAWRTVWLVGGTTVIPTSVETAIKGDGYSVTRINGSDRYETVKLIAEAGTKIAGKKPAKVFVASGTSSTKAPTTSAACLAKGRLIHARQTGASAACACSRLGFYAIN